MILKLEENMLEKEMSLTALANSITEICIPKQIPR